MKRAAARLLSAGLLAAELLVAGLLAAGSAAAQPAAPAPPDPEGFAYVRTVEVPAAGWVRVPLDAAALRHAAADGSTLQVIGPEGEEVYWRVEAYQPPGERRPARVLGVEESPSGAGWVLLLDLGPSPPAHERLLFDFDRRVAAPAVQLEGSADAQRWEPLASGGLFRLGGTEELQRTTLTYPRTDLRYLRLTWPREGGFPEVSRVEVEIPSGPVLTLPVERPDCRPLGRAGTACRLPVAAPGLVAQRLVLEVSGSGALGYRVDQARDGAWWREVEGVRLIGSGSGARTLHLTLGPAGLSGDLLRLELFGDGARPVLSAARVEAAVPTVLFQAAAPGVYTLAYGGVPVPLGLSNTPRAGPGDSGNGGGSPEQAAWREAGPERQLPPPELPGSGPGEPLPEVRFLSSWNVRAPGESRAGAERSRAVRLELPPEVYARVRPDLGDLRLAVGPKGQERQIPFLLWTPHEPAGVPLPAAAAGGELAVARVDRREHPSWTSGFTVDLPGPARTPLTQVLVILPPGPVWRPVGLEVRAGGAGTPELQATGYLNQPCAARPPLPCRAEFSLAGNARAAGDRWLAEPARMSVLFFDGDDPPLSGVAVEAFRRRDVLVFVWPEGDSAGNSEVRLLAGAAELEAPSYQLARLRDGLLAQPWRPAALDSLGETRADGGRHGRWLLLGTLALAAVALVVLLRRVLKEV